MLFQQYVLEMSQECGQAEIFIRLSSFKFNSNTRLFFLSICKCVHIYLDEASFACKKAQLEGTVNACNNISGDELTTVCCDKSINQSSLVPSTAMPVPKL